MEENLFFVVALTDSLRSQSAAMRTLIASIVLALASCTSANAQSMSTAEYQAFLKILDSKLPEWTRGVSSIDVGKMSVSYRQGKMVADAQAIVIRDLELIHRYVKHEADGRRLSYEITLSQLLADAESEVETMINFLPDSAESVRWGRAEGLPLTKDMNNYSQPLRKNIDAYADELQDRAEKCSR